MFYHRKELFRPVNVGTPDPQFGQFLLEQFGGATSELTAMPAAKLTATVVCAHVRRRTPRLLALWSVCPPCGLKVPIDIMLLLVGLQVVRAGDLSGCHARYLPANGRVPAPASGDRQVPPLASRPPWRPANRAPALVTCGNEASREPPRPLGTG